VKALCLTDKGLGVQNVAPPRPGPREVVVKVMCAGLCRTDLYVAEGRLASERPRILGHEGSGIVFRLGEEVPQDFLSARVSFFPWLGCGQCSYCRADQDRLYYLCPGRRFLGRHLNGCFSQYLVVPYDRCHRMAEEISFQAAAYLEPVTAALGVLRAPLRDATQVGILGDNRIAGLTSTLLTHHARKEHELLNAEEIEENSFDLIVETDLTEKHLTAALRALRPDGLLVLKSRPAESVPWPTRLQVEKEIHVMALSYGSLTLAKMLLAKKRALFEPLWTEPVPLRDWEPAFERASAGREAKKIFFLPQEC